MHLIPCESSEKLVLMIELMIQYRLYKAKSGAKCPITNKKKKKKMLVKIYENDFVKW